MFLNKLFFFLSACNDFSFVSVAVKILFLKKAAATLKEVFKIITLKKSKNFRFLLSFF